MTIADCGFPAIFTVPGSSPPRVLRGRDVLVRQGPTTLVEIGFSPDLFQADQVKARQALAAASAQAPQRLVAALIDTGACESCIDEELAQELQLPLVDHQEGSGIGGKESFNVYLGYVRIAALGILQYGRFMGVRLKAGNQPHQALLGRTLLQGMIVVYDGRDGSVKVAV